ncbi:MAG: sulfatase-like hydrolase/transferase, partial [Candidatus Latescibacteria bacterium]|nr:sulfatase-like hydrolase/transferase [Candidatus Latescibacterota bacterium]
PFDERWFKIYLWDFLFYDQNLPHTRHLPEDFDLKKLVALYYGMTTWVDDMVGRLMYNLQRHGLSDNTIVLFVSDHGDNLGSHHRFNKGLIIEESIRIPMIFHSTEHWSSRIISDQVAQLIDVMPTLVTTCGGELPASVQGRDLSPTLTGDRSCLDDTDAIIETSGGQIGLRTPNQLAGIQLDDDLCRASNSGHCLYDLEADPYEWNNLLDPFEAGTTNPLIERLVRWNEETPWLTDRA